jgi:DNA-binding MarR family transcriptional regulator
MSVRRRPRGRHASAPRHPRPRAAAVPLLERLAALVRLLGARAARAPAERFGLDAAGWRVVAALGDGAACSAAETATRSALDRTRASRSLQALARAGYLERTHDAFDARRTLFRLSTRGRALYRRVASSARAHERALVAGLTPGERRQLDRLLAKLQRAAETTAD